MNFYDRDSVDVSHGCIEFYEVLPAGQNFAETRDADANFWFTESFFIRIAETWSVPTEVDAGFAFVAVTAEEILGGRLTGNIAEARDVDPNGLSRTTHGGGCAEGRKISASACAANVRRKITAESTAGIAETVRIFARCGVQQNAGGLLSLCAENDCPRVNFVRLFRIAIDIKNSAGAILRRVHQDFVDHRIRDERAVARA